MSVDWRRLKAVVIESDDWGLCAWAPDEAAARALADTPVWRTPAGQRYGRSTLESAADVAVLAAMLGTVRGADGLPAVLQANTVMAAPDYARLAPPTFAADELPLVGFPDFPSRWQRPGLWEAVRAAIARGTWWPELHGLHHLPVAAWLAALRRGDVDALRAFGHQSFVCGAVQASGEFDPAEPAPQRAWNLRGAVARFERVFGRLPASLCPPDYRWNESLEHQAETLGVTTIQGRGEREGRFALRFQRVVQQLRFPEKHGPRFYLPPRIAFEPRGALAPGGPAGLDHAVRAAREAWGRGQPAILSTHRANFAHLDAAWSERGRSALASLLGTLTADGATFLTDAEVRALVDRGWSLRPVGERGAVVRAFGGSGEPLRFVAPPGVTGVSIAGVGGADGAGARATTASTAMLDSGMAELSVGPGTYRLEWSRA